MASRRRATSASMPLAHGFTLIELLVVLAALALLLSVAVPRYLSHVERAKEAVLRQNLAAMRDAIDKFQADKGRFPAELKELVSERYLRSVPQDPMLERNDAWAVTAPTGSQTTGVYDVHSTAPGVGRDGQTYASW